MTVSRVAAALAFAAAALALACLASLHGLSPEFDPSWRMVSEYALGGHATVLSVMFGAWALSSWALAAALLPHMRGPVSVAGLVFLVLSGAGEALAVIYDVRQASMHGVAALIGIPSLPVAAMLLSLSLVRADAWKPVKTPLLIAANLTWVSFVLMGVAMNVFMSQLAASAATPPEGVLLLNGWANRLLIVTYCAWTLVAAGHAWKLPRAQTA